MLFLDSTNELNSFLCFRTFYPLAPTHCSNHLEYDSICQCQEVIQNDTLKHQTLIYLTCLTLTDMIRHLHGHARWGMIAAEPATAGSSMDGSSWGAVYLAGVCTWYHGYTTWDWRCSLSNTTNKDRVDETWNYRTVEQVLSICYNISFSTIA